jgi:hypothetical protein
MLPVIEHFKPSPSTDLLNRVQALSEELRAERRELTPDKEFRPLIPDRLEDAPTLQLDDLSGTKQSAIRSDSSYLEGRARLRAQEGDLLVTGIPPAPGYETYCRESLGLGKTTWLHPEAALEELHLASLCWKDRKVRRTLVHACRSHSLLYIHPYMGSLSVWRTADLLHRSSRRTLKVIGPHPGLAAWVNNKADFARTASRLFGEMSIPPTRVANNLALLSKRVREVAAKSPVIGLKLPSAAGGAGNLVLEAERFRGLSLESIRTELKKLFNEMGWSAGGRLIVGSWETDVLSAPSAQLWIPPELEGPPVVEGIFEQEFSSRQGMFAGARPATFPAQLNQEIANRCWLLALLFQRLGYIGRCSFDLILVGESLEQSRLEFIECNGRWGGTSLPMTLMNRLFGDWTRQPFVVTSVHVKGLNRLEFVQLLEHFAGEIFDHRTGEGRLIFFNPERIRARSRISLIALGSSLSEAEQLAKVDFPAQVQELVQGLTHSKVDQMG